MATATVSRNKKPAEPWPGKPNPTWEVVSLFPSQGEWTEHDYLCLERVCGDHIRVELAQGRLEVLPMPTQQHQRIMRFMLRKAATFVDEHAPGEVLCSGMRVRLKNGLKPKYRQPDLLYMKEEHAHRQHEDYWEGADLVMEIVSGDLKDRERDLIKKPKEYAAAGIGEYWIIDPKKESIRVLHLKGKTYKTHGEFRSGDEATSVLLPGFSVAVDQALRGK